MARKYTITTSKKSSKLDLIESGDNFLLYSIEKEYDREPNLNDEKINSKVKELVIIQITIQQKVSRDISAAFLRLVARTSCI